MALLTRKRLILAKAESPYGTDSTPDGTDAVLVRTLEITPIEADVVSRDLIRPYLGNSDQLLANTRVSITFEVELAGSGTAATAPRFGSLLKACGMAETTTAVAVTGTAQAGAAGSITLAAGASATDDIYNGMIISLTGGTGSGSSGVIVDYNGTTKVATVQKTTAAFTPCNQPLQHRRQRWLSASKRHLWQRFDLFQQRWRAAQDHRCSRHLCFERKRGRDSYD